MSHVKEIKQHKGSVASYKRWISRNLDQINTAKTNKTLDEPFFELKSSKIKEQVSKITDLEHQISALYDIADVSVEEKTRADHRKEI